MSTNDYELEAAGRVGSTEPIAIVGMAGIFPGAGNVAEYWSNICNGVDAISTAPANRIDPRYVRDSAGLAGAGLAGRGSAGSGSPFAGAIGSEFLPTNRGGFVDSFVRFDAPSFGVMPNSVADAEPDQLIALKVASAAIDDAGGIGALGRNDKVGVIVGRGGYLTTGVARLNEKVRGATQLAAVLSQLAPELGAERIESIKREFQAAVGPDRPDATIGLVPNLAASRIANRLDLQGPAFTIDAACASSLVAIDSAVNELRSGRCDSVIAGGIHHCHDITFWSVFAQLGALSTSGGIRPFSRNADGLLIGEGTAMVVLRRLSDALAEGLDVYAVVHGAGVASDGRDSSLLRPRVDGQVLALSRAWAASGLDPSLVGLVEAHGTATAAGDQAELDTVHRFFGAGGDPMAIGSVKSMIGHLMPAAGIAGLIKATLAVSNRVIPPSLHADEPHSDLVASRLYVPDETRPWSDTDRPFAAVNAFGFGGINGHVIIGPNPMGAGVGSGRRWVSDVADAVVTRPPLVEHVVMLEAPTTTEMLALLDGCAPDTTTVTLMPQRRAVETGSSDVVRLCILAPTERKLALARRAVEGNKAWRGRSDVWYVPHGLIDAGGTVCLMYPGVEVNFDPSVRDVALAMGVDEPDLGAGAGGGDASAGAGGATSDGAAALGFQGAGIVEYGRFLTATLSAAGQNADVMIGHSVGEWTALTTSGVISDDQLAQLLERIDPASLEVPGVQFVALGAGAETARQLVEGLGTTVVSHDNCPHQSIVCGPDAETSTVVERARARKVMAQVLPFRSGFHSPAFEPYLGQIREQLDQLTLAAARTPLWSATTVSPYPDGSAEVHRLIIRHLLEPVRFRELVEALYDNGARVFVQMGVGSLPGFVGDTLKGRDHAVFSAGADRSAPVVTGSAGPGVSQLARVIVGLWCEGADVDCSLVHPSAAVRQTGESLGSAATRSVRGRTADVGRSAGHTVSQGVSSASERGELLELGAPLISLSDSVVAANRLATGIAGAAGGGAPVSERIGIEQAASAAGDLAADDRATVGPVAAELNALIGEAKSAAAELANALAARPVRPNRSRTWVRRWADAPAVPTAHSSGGATVRSQPGIESFAGAGRTGPTVTDGQNPGANGVAGSPAGASSASARAGRSGGSGSQTPHGEVTELIVSLETMPYLIDHCFYRQGQGAEHSELFPVVPMTAMCELMMNHALELRPGLVVVELSDIVALRWLPAAPPTAVQIIATPVDDVTVKVKIDGYARCTVRFAATYPPAPVAPAALNDEAPAEALPVPVDAADLYDHRWMFHGPRYQGVTDISAFGPGGIDGTIRHLRDPGAVLDNAGQLMGLWAMQSLDINVLAFPSSIASMKFFGPMPGAAEAPDLLGPAGAAGSSSGPLQCAVRITSVTERGVVADMALFADGARSSSVDRPQGSRLDETSTVSRRPFGSGAGASGASRATRKASSGPAVWCQITRWEDRRFDTDDVLWPFLRFPEVRTVASRQPGGWWLLLERWTDSASRELLARRYSTPDELADYQGRNPLEQRNWLLGRAVLKDAVRQHLWAHGAGPLFPASIIVTHDDRGVPGVRMDHRNVAAGLLSDQLGVSVSHSGRVGVAHLALGSSVGIDIERVQPRGGRFATLALAASERTLLDGLDPDQVDLHLTAMWTAKEAAAKAAHTGLGGRPKDWVVTAFEPDRLRIGDVWVEIAVVDLNAHARAGAGASASTSASASTRPGAPPLDAPVGNATAPDVYVVAWTSGPEVPAVPHPDQVPPGDRR